MDEPELIDLFDDRKKSIVSVEARRTAKGNKSFEYGRTRHIVTAQGAVLQMIRYAYGGPSWEPSPVLRLAQAPGKKGSDPDRDSRDADESAKGPGRRR